MPSNRNYAQDRMPLDELAEKLDGEIRVHIREHGAMIFLKRGKEKACIGTGNTFTDAFCDAWDFVKELELKAQSAAVSDQVFA